MKKVPREYEIIRSATNLISPEEKRIVEVGCGTGSFSIIMREKNINNYIGVDINPYLIEQAKESFPEYKFLVADITENYNIIRKATMVVMIQTLQCIQEDLNFLNNIVHKTKVLISVPNYDTKTDNLRWYEIIDDWKERISDYINVEYWLAIRIPKSATKKVFILYGYRNNFVNKKTYEEIKHETFDTVIARL